MTLVGGVLPLCSDAVGVFCRLIWLGQKYWDCIGEEMDIRNGKVDGEIKSVFIAVQSNTIRTKNTKAKIDNVPQNIKCRLYEDTD